jgi:SNF2 family DNA or RNA helicase
MRNSQAPDARAPSVSAAPLRELPLKGQQTLYCELDTRQRGLYDQLRDHYRATLLKRVQTDGVGRTKILILEALLRLRQAAIHPGLLDKGGVAEPSAKLDVLLPVIKEGHKTLVFSQLTGMLAILRQHLDREGVPYESGRTRDRKAGVERFQTNPGCKLMLISLKAGGVGLNRRQRSTSSGLAPVSWTVEGLGSGYAI